jgi:hypothetical protein
MRVPLQQKKLELNLRQNLTFSSSKREEQFSGSYKEILKLI